MADVHNMQTRSYNMSRIKNKNTNPEMLVRKFLFSKGFRYRLHVKNLPGKPDIVLPRYKTVIFVNGCFWHGHENCKYYVIPKTKTEWWTQKIVNTQIHDHIAKQELEKLGWKVVVVWECELKKDKRTNALNSLALIILE